MASEKLLKQLKKNNKGDYITITELVTNSGSKQVDIRTYYTDEESGEIKPTKRGIRLNTELLGEILPAVIETMEPDERDELIDSLVSDYR